MAGSRRYHKCPACGKVSYFSPDEPTRCRKCGRGADTGDAARAEASAPTPSADATPQPGDAAGSPGQDGQEEYPALLGILSLALGVIALFSVGNFPIALLAAAGALTTGILALNREDAAGAPRGLAIAGIVLGGIALLVILILFMAWSCFFGCTYIHGSSYDDGHDGGSGGGDPHPDRGGSGGGGDGSGGGGGGGGSGGTGGGGGGEVGAPAAGPMAFLSVFAVGAWQRRRRG